VWLIAIRQLYTELQKKKNKTSNKSVTDIESENLGNIFDSGNCRANYNLPRYTVRIQGNGKFKCTLQTSSNIFYGHDRKPCSRNVLLYCCEILKFRDLILDVTKVTDTNGEIQSVSNPISRVH
jgi:hypothetical protein